MSQKTYFIKDPGNGLIKIGKSVDPSGRIADFQTHHASELQLLAVYPDDLESYLHEKFRKHHVRGEWFQPDEEILAWIEKRCGSAAFTDVQLGEQVKWLLFQHPITGDVGIVEWAGLEPEDAEAEIREKHLRPKRSNQLRLLGAPVGFSKDELRPLFGFFGDDPPSRFADSCIRRSHRFRWAWSYSSDELTKWLSLHCPDASHRLQQHYWAMVRYSHWDDVEYIGLTRTSLQDATDTCESVMQQIDNRWIRNCCFLGRVRVVADCVDLRSRFKHLHSYSPNETTKYKVRHQWDWFQASRPIVEWIGENRIDDGDQSANDALSALQDQYIPRPPSKASRWWSNLLMKIKRRFS